MADGNDIEALLQNRILSNSGFTRAAVYDKQDVAQMAGYVYLTTYLHTKF